ncbi:hypothetical protein HETIRDRAFT_68397 [Heterobasidion irregulare TC 32-1]|uniref:TRAM domain-containing protein n=1 Tax=Heterobasidion irregulare (strain TC 32-1) TaxID=747525 RepID=W4JY70_HETIT|nr:uncharacterized protein HETIRDRAFT_68397 [Heterobasidion irregulare TC 32-1]ETW78399.1 hypothetical protein HETIRDRAFT_68397 [Heterobasidion irregulare TC 32-1]
MLQDNSKTRPASAVEDLAQPLAEKRPRLEVPNETVEDGVPGTIPAADESAGISENPSERAKAKPSRQQKRRKEKLPVPGTSEDVIFNEVVALLGKSVVDEAFEKGTERNSPFEFREIVELTVSSISPSGEGLALAPASRGPWVVVVPFALPGEVIQARVYRTLRMYSHADLVSVETPNPEFRDMSLVKCKHFGTCAGCQYQMIPYDKQLDLKRDVVVKAYENYSDLPESSIPPIQSTVASPLQYGYRTKITPHFDAPPKKPKKSGLTEEISATEKPDWLNIGFNQIGKRKVLDIEECPIATPVINAALGPLRKGIIKNIYEYKRGVSLLLRDSLKRPAVSSALEKHVCVTDHRHIVRERVGDKLFDYQAGSFFQNNNSVLVPLTEFVRDAVFPSSSSSPSSERPTHLVDAYCGAGLFAITLAPHFQKVAGIELSADSIRFATQNAELNRLQKGLCSFRAGDAANIFSVVSDFPPEKTVVIIDPPRKGCDDNFIDQLLTLRPRTVVYVSCNVHTQAKDVGRILRLSEEGTRGKYVIESLRGFDLFPQTSHVESVAVLRLSSMIH